MEVLYTPELLPRIYTTSAIRWEGSKTRDDGWRSGLSANSWRNERSAEHPPAKPAAGVEPLPPHKQFKKRENLAPSRDQLGNGGGETKLRSWENVPEWANNSLSENREGGFDDMGKFKVGDVWVKLQ